MHVIAENPITGERTYTNTAYLVYVALDDDGQSHNRTCPNAETEEEKQRMEKARERQERQAQEQVTSVLPTTPMQAICARKS